MRSTSIKACFFVAILGVGVLAACGGGDAPTASVATLGSGGVPNPSVAAPGSVTGPIQSVDALTGVLKVIGMAVTADATTLVVDGRTGSTGPLVLTDLRIGDSVHVDFNQFRSFQASRIERRDPSTQFEILQASFNVSSNGVPYPTIVYDQQTQYFGSCSDFRMAGPYPQSPAWGPCSANEFWADFVTWPATTPDLTVNGAIRQSDGAPVATVVSVFWN